MLDYEDELTGYEEINDEEEIDEIESSEVADVLLPLTYFDHANGSDGYRTKQDLINKVRLFSEISRRSITVVTSNSHRYSVKCIVPDCKFQLNFHFGYGITYCKPKNAVQHTCTMDDTCPSHVTPSFLVQRQWVQEWMQKEQRSAETSGLRRECASNGLQVPYYTLHRTITLLRKQYFIDDIKQYEYMESYTKLLNEKGQFAVLEKEENTFCRWCVVYREGIQGMRIYLKRGLQLDATFIKNGTGGKLYVCISLRQFLAYIDTFQVLY